MKSLNRIWIIIQNSVNNLITPVISILFSYIIVNKYNAGLWGSFVYYLIILNLTTHLLGWGNKDYLLREFSRNTKSITSIWFESILTRSIAFPVIIILFYFLSDSFNEYIILVILAILFYIYQSFDVLIIYNRKFIQAFFTEIISFAILTGLIFSFGISNLYSLLSFYAISFSSKPLMMFLFFGKFLFGKRKFSFHLNFRFYIYSFQFFIIGFTGLVQSRLDLYLTGFYLQKENLGKYQVIINFLAILQALAGFIVSPFVKDIYRMKNESVKKLEQRIGSYGVILSFPLVFIIYFVLFYFYNFDLSPDYIFYFLLFVIPVYMYIVPVYNLYKNGNQNKVMLITIGGIIVSLVSGIILIPLMEIKGALLSNIISQVFMLLAYYYENSKIFLKLYAEKS